MPNAQTRETPASELSMEDLEQIVAGDLPTHQNGQNYEVTLGTNMS